MILLCYVLAIVDDINLIFSLHESVIQVVFVVCTGEENSRVQAHIDGDEFSAHILTDQAEYNIEVNASFKIVFV